MIHTETVNVTDKAMGNAEKCSGFSPLHDDEQTLFPMMHVFVQVDDTYYVWPAGHAVVQLHLTPRFGTVVEDLHRSTEEIRDVNKTTCWKTWTVKCSPDLLAFTNTATGDQESKIRTHKDPTKWTRTQSTQWQVVQEQTETTPRLMQNSFSHFHLYCPWVTRRPCV